jgi:hypothetical protein
MSVANRLGTQVTKCGNPLPHKVIGRLSSALPKFFLQYFFFYFQFHRNILLDWLYKFFTWHESCILSNESKKS